MGEQRFEFQTSKTLTLAASGFIWVAPMAFETITFVLSTYKLYEKAIRSQTNSSLLPVLYRDGVCHYLVRTLLSQIGNSEPLYLGHHR